MSAQVKEVKVLIVNKGGALKEMNMNPRTLQETLYKTCGFKNTYGFLKHAAWTYGRKKNAILIELWGRDSGGANQENKYEFPPPVDNILFFGMCALVALQKDSKEYVDLTVANWKKIYEYLFGGFENLADNEQEDEEEEDELDHIASHLKTKDGYLKDGFIIEDAIEDANDNDDDGESSASTEESTSAADEEESESLSINSSQHEHEKRDSDDGKSSESSDDDNESSELSSEEYDYSSDE
jgi:hypothetical protein